MKLVIQKTPQTENFFRFSPHICESYGIDFYTTSNVYETKEMPNDILAGLGFLALDEVITRHVYKEYDSRQIDVKDIDNFTEIVNDDGFMNEFLFHISNFDKKENPEE